MQLRRRILVSGSAAALLYCAFALLAILAAGSSVKPLHEAASSLLAGLAGAFILGSITFGLVPHFLGNFMANSSSSLELLNKTSLAVALISILVGVLSALALIFGLHQAMKPLLVSITLFIGAAAVMCSLKFFYTNRDNE